MAHKATRKAKGQVKTVVASKKAKRKKPKPPKPPRRYRSIALERAIVKAGGYEIFLERLREKIPNLPPMSPPRYQLTKEQEAYLEAQLVQDMQVEKPTVISWNQWLQAKAEFFQVYIGILDRLMLKHFAKVHKACKHYDYQQSQSVAQALGVGRVRIYKKLDELLDAKRPIMKWVYDGPDDKVGHEQVLFVPDTKIQLEAMKVGAKLYGDAPPSHTVHEVEAGEELTKLTEAELAVKWQELQQQKEALGLLKERHSKVISGHIEAV